MKLRLSPIASDIFITVYITITLLGRLYIEPMFRGHFLISIFLGLFALLILWVLVKLKFLNPSWFGLFNNKK
ncbi:MAG: hypothetical protein L3J45_00585 [Flavobacteriaceae bacterium]|nr:hypothetical protein [Flavobacteriaceae bacterium]